VWRAKWHVCCMLVHEGSPGDLVGGGDSWRGGGHADTGAYNNI
jgi:hypothetical protein